MRPFIALNIGKTARLNLLLSAAAAVILAGCSSSADRLTSNSSQNDPIYTASVPSSIQENDAGTGVSSRPLGSSNYASNAKNYETAPQQQVYSQPIYRQPAYQQPKPVYAPQPQVAAVASPAMRAESGEIQVEPGMTLFSIARSNNVSVRSLADANNLSPPYAVRTGQVLRMPGSGEGQVAAIAPKRQKSGGSHTVKSGETLYSLGRSYGVSPYAIADANNLSHDTVLGVGQSLSIPGGGSASVASAPAPKKIMAGPVESTVAKSEDAATPEPVQQTAELLKPKDQSQLAPTADPQISNAAVDPSLPGFRWPVKGQIISAYGSKPNGLRNEGINISVPEGTSVRAAESGVVAYAGNELKGYGNLVLVRHEGGWVTAYAHNKELFVKRGDTVKRGDVVAKAGRTGTVSSPQVHFEIRKGATAMDPMKFLGNTTAAN